MSTASVLPFPRVPVFPPAKPVNCDANMLLYLNPLLNAISEDLKLKDNGPSLITPRTLPLSKSDETENIMKNRSAFQPPSVLPQPYYESSHRMVHEEQLSALSKEKSKKRLRTDIEEESADWVPEVNNDLKKLQKKTPRKRRPTPIVQSRSIFKVFSSYFYLFLRDSKLMLYFDFVCSMLPEVKYLPIY